MSVVIGGLLIRETQGVRIWDEVGGGSHARLAIRPDVAGRRSGPGPRGDLGLEGHEVALTGEFIADALREARRLPDDHAS